MLSALPGVLFLLLAIVVLLPRIPLRWSLLAFLLISQINLTEAGFASATALGVENTLKGIVLPSLLLMRTRFAGLRSHRRSLMLYLWLFFCLYALIAASWSPFKLSALKQIGFFYSYTISFFVLVETDRRASALMDKYVGWLLGTGILLAIVQTFLLGNRFGGLDSRFTSFTAPQNFGLFLVLSTTLLLASAHKAKRSFGHVILLFAIVLVAIFFNGSRIGLLSITLLVAITGLVWALGDRKLTRSAILGLIASGTSVMLGTLLVFPNILPDRLRAALLSTRALIWLNSLTGQQSFQSVATFDFRVRMYSLMLEELERRSGLALIFGSGTSSTAELVTSGLIYYRGYTANNIDANRIAHNEYLRTVYEWGLPGAVLFGLFIVALLYLAFLPAFRSGQSSAFLLATGLIIALLYLLVENLLASPVSPAGLAVTLLIAKLSNQARFPAGAIGGLATRIRTSGSLPTRTPGA